MSKKNKNETCNEEQTMEPEVTEKTETYVSDTPPGEIDQLKAELENQKDQLLRCAAEFDNYKRRTEKERLAVGEYTKAATLKALLPTLDNIERSAAVSPDSPEYAKGIEMIIKQFKETVTNLGLTEIEAQDCEFDPALHEAVMHIEDESLGENVVTEVLQKGYKVGDTVVRHAMVKVAN